MKHSTLLTAVGLGLCSFGCGSADNAASAQEGSGTGAQWLPPVDVGEAGATSTDDDVDDPTASTADGEEDVVQATAQDLVKLTEAWTIQLPNNTSFSATGEHKPWYYSSGGSTVFADPSVGTTTSGSQHCRSEMREAKPWKASGTNSITVTGKVTKGSSGVTIGQVFNDNDSITLAELQWTGSKFQVLYEEAKHQGHTYPVGGSTGLNKTYTYTLSLTKGELTVKIAGGGTWTWTPTSKVSGHNFYFKVGNYDQHSTGTPKTKPSADIRSTVEVSAITVLHK